MSIFEQARKSYLDGKYSEALIIYRKASEIFGEKLVSYNIYLCEKMLKDSPNDSLSPLDCVTQILLYNSQESIHTITPDRHTENINFYNSLKTKKSESLAVKQINPVPADWPESLTLRALPESTNDYSWLLEKEAKNSIQDTNIGLSVIIPTFNRSEILDITLSCLVNQITEYPFEVIVSDDGSQEDITLVSRKYENSLDIKYVRKKDCGYQLCATRNLGLRTAKYDYVSILDCDMAPGRHWVQSYMSGLIESSDIALIGPRKYIDTHSIMAEDILANPELISSLPEVKTNNSVSSNINGKVSVDWRLEHFQKTDNLRLCDSPFRFFSGGNIAFAKKWLAIAGWFDEEFTHWGGEDNEFGYRLYRSGCFFKAIDGALAYHQEPPGRENETDRAAGQEVTIKIVEQKTPYFYRKLEPINRATIKRVPLVSIYIPAYNCEEYIERCVTSALNQTIVDLEVCICDDGSTDGTLQLLKRLYSDHPRVRFMTHKNGGIGAASNAAVKMCRGFYIGQLDSDDYLEPDAVETCLKEFFSDTKLACVYTANRNVNPDGSLISNGYNWPEYSREKFTTAMICHHFRMFTIRAWILTDEFDENITNAVDYDMYLKLSEIGPFKHVNKICYNRVIHGNNTSIINAHVQKENHFNVVNKALKRQNIKNWKYEATSKNEGCRKYKLTKT
ncbi:glycosyltransferase family 2 protein [Zobellella aerophila]|uniref:Acetylgalactosaminyl-proteoglycan 3-beta-glucuronosyltransferase n=1 Tax=Zobellella aerophila TaxID=870480 RepID=A0ABP6V8E4_9GAMM